MPAVLSKPIPPESKTIAEMFRPLHDSFLKKLCDIHYRSTGQAIATDDLTSIRVSLSAISEEEVVDFVDFFKLASEVDVDVFDMMPSGAISAVSLLALQRNIVEIVAPILQSRIVSDQDFVKGYLDTKLGSILHIAAQSCGAKMINLLIDLGVDPNKESEFGSPLYVAVKYGNLEATQVLIDRGANPNLLCDSFHFTAAYVATLNHQKEILRAISRHKDFDPNIASGKNNLTPLYCAAVCGFRRVVEILLQENKGVKIDVNVTNSDGSTALHAAVLDGDKDTIALLVNEGANKDLKNNKGFSPFDYACQSGNQEVLDLLTKKSKKRNKRDGYKNKVRGRKRVARVDAIDEFLQESAAEIDESRRRLADISSRVDELLEQQRDRHVELDDFRQAAEMRVAKELDAQAQKVADELSALSVANDVTINDQPVAIAGKKELDPLVVDAASFLQSRFTKAVQDSERSFDKAVELVDKACGYYSWLQNFNKLQSQTVNLAKGDQKLDSALKDDDVLAVNSRVASVMEHSFASLVGEVQALVSSSWDNAGQSLGSKLCKLAIDTNNPVKLQVMQQIASNLDHASVVTDSGKIDLLQYCDQKGADLCKKVLQEMKKEGRDHSHPGQNPTLSTADSLANSKVQCKSRTFGN